MARMSGNTGDQSASKVHCTLYLSLTSYPSLDCFTPNHYSARLLAILAISCRSPGFSDFLPPARPDSIAGTGVTSVTLGGNDLPVLHRTQLHRAIGDPFAYNAGQYTMYILDENITYFHCTALERDKHYGSLWWRTAAVQSLYYQDIVPLLPAAH